MSWIQLNVGGVMMETMLSTVTKYPDSALARMFHNHSEGSVGVYNIDCNPEYFKLILEWLRYNTKYTLLKWCHLYL